MRPHRIERTYRLTSGRASGLARRPPSRPAVEALERRLALAFAGGTGAVVTGLAESPSRTAIVVAFDGPLVPATAEDVGNYQVNAAGAGNPQRITSAGSPVPILSAEYDAGSQQVTLTFAGPLAANRFYRVRIAGQPGGGLQDVLTTTNPDGSTTAENQTFDGDADDTVAGDFYGLVGLGRRLTFADRDGDTATLRTSGPGRVQVWRQINGDIAELGVVGAVANRTTALSGSVRRGQGGDGKVAINSAPALVNVANRLSPSAFPLQAALNLPPAPVVATAKNLPYSLRIEAITLPSVPSIQSAVSAQAGGKWLIFGGRTNGLHGFDPSGVDSFPPLAQNNDIFVIDPATGQTWAEPWAATGLSATTWASLASSNQESYQQGDRLYAVGGYSSTTDAAGNVNFRTYDTLSSISVAGLMAAVMTQGSAVGSVKQVQDPRFEVTGGDISTIGDRTYLVFGQDFQGGYNGSTGTSNGSQVYTDEIRSFRIIDDGPTLAIADYQAQRDPVNFRRRDGNIVPAVFPDGKQGLVYYGGVFTVPAGGGYRNPVVIGADGVGRVDGYQQFFSQYTSGNATLYDAQSKSLATVLLGGIGLYDYDFATGTLNQDSELPFVDDVTSLVRGRDGSSREYIMPSQFPGLYGAAATYLASTDLPTYSNGVINLRAIKGEMTLGYVYGGIVSTVGDTTDPADQTTASSRVFKVTIVPRP